MPDLSQDYVQQILACAALLLAAVTLRILPSAVRFGLFIMLIGTAVVGGLAGAASRAMLRMFE